MESNISSLKVDMYEYCVLEERLYISSSTAKISIPKLTLSTEKGRTYPSTSLLINDPACKPQSLGPVVISGAMSVKTFTNIGDSRKVVRPENGSAYIPAGAQLIVCFMNGNINDAYLTGLI